MLTYADDGALEIAREIDVLTYADVC